MKKVGYSVTMRKNPMDPEAPEKAYGVLQTNGILDIDEMGKHMSQHGSKYNRGDIGAVLVQLTDCMKEMLASGYKIKLGDIGTFTPTITTTPAETLEKFTEANITKVNVKFQPGEYLQNLRQDIDFEYVASRKTQQAAAAAEKKGETTVDIGKTNETDAPGE